MSASNNRLEAFAEALAVWAIRLRWIVIAASVAATVYIGQNIVKLEYSNNYRAFFSKENPELQAFEAFQHAYAKNDNFLFVLEPKDDRGAFTTETLAAAEVLTEKGWSLPYAMRVDSVVNFQHTYAGEDELIIEDLIEDARALSPEALAEKRAVALAEPLLRDQLVTADGLVTAVNVTLQYPERSLTEVPEAVAAARALRDETERAFPHLDIHLTGTSMLNNAIVEASVDDFGSLIPLMFAIILISAAVALRSLSATAATLAIIVLSSLIAMGFAGHMGVKLAGPSPSAPIIILTLAIADSVHVLISMRASLRDGLEKRAAIIEAVRVNFLPVSVTSITTMVGFLSLQFSDSPPFRDLGVITAVGVLAAWILSLTLLPALLSFTPMRVAPREEGRERNRAMRALADFVIARPRLLFVSAGLAAVALISFIPTLTLSDQWREYFAPRIEFRAETDKAIEHFGFYPVEFSVPAGAPGAVSEPSYLETLAAFTEWLRTQPDVRHVHSISDIMKRLNKNLNGDDPAFYRLPEERDLAAQYLLLYELSLPFGLDLNDRITIDKSATRVTVSLDGGVTTARTREFLQQSEQWFRDNAPGMEAPATGAQVMFTFIAQRNVESMISGIAIAIAVIAVIMVLALRSLPMGLVSLAPNALPILCAFGVWALLVGEIGFSVAAVAAISFGIVIDDTVHFLVKFMRARRGHGLSCADSVRHAFETAGVPIIINTVILSAGFLVLMVSAFKINVELGLLTSLAITFALLLDFFFLPAALMLFPRLSGDPPDVDGENHAQNAYANAD